MPPPLLPDFPLLTALGTPSPPPSPPPLRDPRTGTAISPSPISQADHTRQRLKLVRLQHTVTDPISVATHVESVIAKREVRYAALHASREAQNLRDRADRARRWREDGDPFAAWDTFRVLPGELFYRPPVPSSVALVTGIPDIAWGFGGVCMVQPLREDLFRPGRTVPVFAGEVTRGMGLLRKFDPVARQDRTERFDVMRVERAVYFASAEGKRDEREKCLRCRVRGLPCSFERMRGREKGLCEGCRRNGCKFCLGVLAGGPEDDMGTEKGYTYVRVKKVRQLKRLDFWVYVKVEGEVDIEEVTLYAEELLDAEGVSLWGTTVDSGAVVLPSWKDAYCKSLARKRELDKEFVEEWTGEEVQLEEIDREGVTWKDYFQLLDEKWRLHNPYQPREPRRLLCAESST